jgi:hypothetical protein
MIVARREGRAPIPPTTNFPHFLLTATTAHGWGVEVGGKVGRDLDIPTLTLGPTNTLTEESALSPSWTSKLIRIRCLWTIGGLTGPRS